MWIQINNDKYSLRSPICFETSSISSDWRTQQDHRLDGQMEVQMRPFEAIRGTQIANLKLHEITVRSWKIVLKKILATVPASQELDACTSLDKNMADQHGGRLVGRYSRWCIRLIRLIKQTLQLQQEHIDSRATQLDLANICANVHMDL